MLIYMVYDKQTGKIVHTHRAVDVAGHSRTCTQDEVLDLLPGNLDRATLGIVSTEIEHVPSGRHEEYSVDLASGALVKTPVAKGYQTAKK